MGLSELRESDGFGGTRTNALGYGSGKHNQIKLTVVRNHYAKDRQFGILNSRLDPPSSQMANAT